MIALCADLLVKTDGIVHREQYPGVPSKVKYSPTELGQMLIPMIRQMREWGDRYFELAGAPSLCDDISPCA